MGLLFLLASSKAHSGCSEFNDKQNPKADAAKGKAEGIQGKCAADAATLCAGDPSHTCETMKKQQCEASCKPAADEKVQSWKGNLAAAEAAYCKANAEKNSPGSDPGQQRKQMGGAGGVACKGADLNGDKAKGLEPMKNMDCNISGCEEFPTASADAKEIEQACNQSKMEAALEQADQLGKQSQNQQNCEENKANEKKEDKPPQIPPLSPPPEEKKDKPESKPPPQLAAPPSGITERKDVSKSPIDFSKPVKTSEGKAQTSAGGDSDLGRVSNRSGTNEGLGKSGSVVSPALSKVDGGSGSGASSSGGSTAAGTAKDSKPAAPGALGAEEGKPVELGGASAGGGRGYGGKGASLLGVSAGSEEFDALKKEIDGGPKPANLGVSAAAEGTQGANQGIAGDHGPTLFQLTHAKYMNLWKRAQF